tara:strand:+ start:472 stop:597 length:126 start_codon:yes stop_codon:yes gene_type:complete
MNNLSKSIIILFINEAVSHIERLLNKTYNIAAIDDKISMSQ